MDQVYQLNCPLLDMSPIAVEPDFTRKYLQSSNNEALVKKIAKAFDRVAWEKDFVLCEGSGHAGVGSVFDLSNAQVAQILGAKVIIISQGGIGKPIDEVYLNQAVFEREGVEVIGVILNKVTSDKIDYVTEFARRGLKRKGLDLLGVLPHRHILSRPTLAAIQEELKAKSLNNSSQFDNMVVNTVVGAMSAPNAEAHFKRGTLVITPGDREDIILAATAAAVEPGRQLAGMILTEKIKPANGVLKVIEKAAFPILLSGEDSFEVASQVHNLSVKTRPADTEKISVIRDLIAAHVDVDKILRALKL
jgi:BioD-like phosphotransacetylase family protein